MSATLGPRTIGNEEQYERLLADIAHGVRLHYGEPGEDPDLDLLEGDRLYARGLSTLADLGDLPATSELADVISLIAQARASGADELAEAIWQAGSVAVGWGADERYIAAKELAREQAPTAAKALLEAARMLRHP